MNPTFHKYFCQLVPFHCVILCFTSFRCWVSCVGKTKDFGLRWWWRLKGSVGLSRSRTPCSVWPGRVAAGNSMLLEILRGVRRGAAAEQPGRYSDIQISRPSQNRAATGPHAAWRPAGPSIINPYKKVKLNLVIHYSLFEGFTRCVHSWFGEVVNWDDALTGDKCLFNSDSIIRWLGVQFAM